MPRDLLLGLFLQPPALSLRRIDGSCCLERTRSELAQRCTLGLRIIFHSLPDHAVLDVIVPFVVSPHELGEDVCDPWKISVTRMEIGINPRPPSQVQSYVQIQAASTWDSPGARGLHILNATVTEIAATGLFSSRAAVPVILRLRPWC